MKNTYVYGDQTLTQIPIEEIVRCRRNFPNGKLLYKVHFFCDRLRGLSDLFLAFGAAELQIASVKAEKSGSVYCVIEDNSAADLEWFEAKLVGAATLVSWTTQIDYPC
jgi:hypothetical protein